MKDYHEFSVDLDDAIGNDNYVYGQLDYQDTKIMFWIINGYEEAACWFTKEQAEMVISGLQDLVNRLK